VCALFQCAECVNAWLLINDLMPNTEQIEAVVFGTMNGLYGVLSTIQLLILLKQLYRLQSMCISSEIGYL